MLEIYSKVYIEKMRDLFASILNMLTISIFSQKKYLDLLPIEVKLTLHVMDDLAFYS